MIKFYCIHCGTKIAAEDEWQGLESACPTCQQTVQVPGDFEKTKLPLEINQAPTRIDNTPESPQAKLQDDQKHPVRISGTVVGFIVVAFLAISVVVLVRVSGVMEQREEKKRKEQEIAKNLRDAEEWDIQYEKRRNEREAKKILEQEQMSLAKQQELDEVLSEVRYIYGNLPEAELQQKAALCLNEKKAAAAEIRSLLNSLRAVYPELSDQELLKKGGEYCSGELTENAQGAKHAREAKVRFDKLRQAARQAAGE